MDITTCNIEEPQQKYRLGMVNNRLLDLNNLGGGPLDAKYQGTRPCGFRQEDFLRFPYIRLCKTSDLGAWPFFTPGL